MELYRRADLCGTKCGLCGLLRGIKCGLCGVVKWNSTSLPSWISKELTGSLERKGFALLSKKMLCVNGGLNNKGDCC